MDEETLAIYDLLSKPDLTAKEIQKIKNVAKELLEILKDKLKNLYKWQDKEPTRDEVKVLIRNYLWDEKTGLPVDFYTQDDVERKAEEVFNKGYEGIIFLSLRFACFIYLLVIKNKQAHAKLMVQSTRLNQL